MLSVKLIIYVTGTGKTYIGLQIMKLLLANSLGTDDCPILIVCYTSEKYFVAMQNKNFRYHIFFVVDHALDQFLEGILSIMKSLNVNPYGQLVRVGGQSKVDEIDQFNIRNIRSEYIKRKQFNDHHASLRSRTSRELKLLENYRSDLKSLFGDLCRLSGIVNFNKLGLQIRQENWFNDSELDSLIPDELAKIFLKQNGATVLDFLRLNNIDFNSNNFSVEKVLKHWFRITLIPTAIKKAEVNEEEETLEPELEDEELRSMLVAHRLEEEILEEDRNYQAARVQYHLCHAYDAKFKSQEDGLYSELLDAERQRNNRDIKRLRGALYELGLQRTKFMNQCNFVKELVRNYLSGRIVLPIVTPELLAKANERASLWRLSLSEKWSLYFYFIDEIKKYLLGEIIKIEAKIMDEQKVMEEVKNQGDGFILKRSKVVGMTTTGAAKYNTVLRMMQSKIGMTLKS